jgi:jasmonate ZIM domain-containing protein
LEPERAQLTIFYDGKTIVFDDFPADKADELMQLAGSFVMAPAASGDEPVCQIAPVEHFLAGIAKDRSYLQTAEQAETESMLSCRQYNELMRMFRVCSSDMPIARKASLQRFLEKRKTRLAAADPYPVGAAKEAGGKPAGNGDAPWLGVNTGLHLN